MMVPSNRVEMTTRATSDPRIMFSIVRTHVLGVGVV